MKLSKIDAILLSLVSLSLIFWAYITYNEGCTGRGICFGPAQIVILGFPFNSIIVDLVVKPLMIGLVGALAAACISYMRKKSRSEAIGLIIRFFSIGYLSLSTFDFIVLTGYVY